MNMDVKKEELIKALKALDVSTQLVIDNYEETLAKTKAELATKERLLNKAIEALETLLRYDNGTGDFSRAARTLSAIRKELGK